MIVDRVAVIGNFFTMKAWALMCLAHLGQRAIPVWQTSEVNKMIRKFGNQT